MTDMRIADLRRERGWTQEHLAAMSGVGVRTIQRLEAGDDGSLETLRRVAAALEVPVPELFAAAEPADVTASSEDAVPAPSVPSSKRDVPWGGIGRIALLVGSLALAGALTGATAGVARPVAFVSSTHAFVSMQGTWAIRLLEASNSTQAVVQADAQLLTEPIVLDRAASRLGADGRGLREAVSVQVEPDSAVLLIHARGGSADIATRRANAVVRSLIEVIPSVTPSGSGGGQRVTQLDAPTSSIDLGVVVRAAGIGLGGGLVLGAAVASIRRRPPGAPPGMGRLAVS